MSNDWYTSSNWNSDVQELFKKKIKRARSSKIHYILTKARVLYRTKDASKMNAAKELLHNALSEYRNEKYDIPNMAEELARWYLTERNFKKAEHAIDEYFQLISEGKIAVVRLGVATPHQMKAELLMLSGDLQKMKEAVKLISDYHKELDKRNNNKTPYIPSFTLLKSKNIKDIQGEEINNIEFAWEGYELQHSDLDYKIIHAKNKASLDYLWEYLFEGAVIKEYKTTSYSWYETELVVISKKPYRAEYRDKDGELFWYIAEFGAYIGQILVNEMNGSWNKKIPIMESTVNVGNEQINPFLIAYYIVLYRFPLKYAVKKFDLLKILLKETEL